MKQFHDLDSVSQRPQLAHTSVKSKTLEVTSTNFTLKTISTSESHDPQSHVAMTTHHYVTLIPRTVTTATISRAKCQLHLYSHIYKLLSQPSTQHEPINRAPTLLLLPMNHAAPQLIS